MKKIVSFLCVCILLTVALGIPCVAAPTDSFTRKNEPGNEVTPVQARESYVVSQLITASSLGLEAPLEGMTDICSGADGRIYLLCGAAGESRVIILREDYTLYKELVVQDAAGDEIDFSGAQGIFVDGDNSIYIADTDNGQILITDETGVVKETWGKPDSSYIPEEFAYQPMRVVKDAKGYLYVLSLGNYYGALSYSPEGEFLGFYGANSVKAGVMDALATLWEKLTSNDVKKSQSSRKLPYSFVDLCVDAEGYVITCTGRTESGTNAEGQIRKFSSNGSNILYQRNPDGSATSSSSVNFLEKEVIVANTDTRTQNIVAVETDVLGNIYALDKTYGLIYVFDKECNLLTGFGGGFETGGQKGNFRNATAMCLQGDSVLVVDTDTYGVTVFSRTDFGELLFQAEDLYIRGDYSEAQDLWKQVLALDAGNQMAYKGLAMATYGEGDYQTALRYAKDGMDYSIYDLAWQEVLSDFFARNFIWVALLVVVILGGLIVLVVRVKKRGIVLIRNAKIKTYTSVVFHPFRAFEEVKYKKQGSLVIAGILTVLLFASVVLQSTASGFLYNTTTAKSYNILYTLLETVGVLLLWSVSNWLICSLFSGKGTLREVFIGTTYACTPLIVLTFLRWLLSLFLPLTSSGFLSGLTTVAWIYAAFLLCIAMITIHEYDFFKFLSTGVGIVFLMIVIIFMLFFTMTMLNMCKIFVTEFCEELFFR